MPGTKYLDHGLYLTENVRVTGNPNKASTVMNMTSIDPTGDPLLVGTILDFPAPYALDYPIYVSVQLGNGTGNGNYTLSSTPLSDGSGVALTGRGGYAKDPWIWGQPLEGDGLAYGKAVAAVVSIDLTGASAAAGNKFQLSGAELSCVASAAGNNQFNAGSGATLVANLVAAINRTANTVTVLPHVTGWYAHKVQDVFFARADPGNSSILQIMTRAGSAAYNGTSAFAAVMVGFTGVTGGTTRTFSGGVSGAWGYFLTPAIAMWPSAIAAYTYGVYAPIPPLAGVVEAGDEVIMRSHSKFGGYTCYLLNNPNNGVVTFPHFSGTVDQPVLLRNYAKDGTIPAWENDGAEPQFSVGLTNTSNAQTYTCGVGSASSYADMVGSLYPSGKRGISFTCYGPNVINVSPRLIIRFGSQNTFENVDFIGNNYGTVALAHGATSSTQQRTSFINCRVSWERQRPGAYMIQATKSGWEGGGDFVGCLFECRNPDAAQDGGILDWAPTNSPSNRYNLIGCTFSGWRPGTKLGASVYGNVTTFYMVWNFRNCEFGEITNFGPNLRDYARVNSNGTAGHTGIFISSNLGKCVTMLDMPVAMIEWNPATNPPCLNARLEDNTSWVYRVLPSIRANVVELYNPVELPLFAKRLTAASGVKKVTVNFLLEKSMSWTRCDVSILVQYVDTNNVLRSETTLVRRNPPLLAAPASQNIWTRPLGNSAMSIDPADLAERATFYSNGVELFFNQRILELQTRYPVKTNTEVSVNFRVHRIASFDTDQFFVDPDFTIGDVA